MSSQFYKRYLPPPKVSKSEQKLTRNQSVEEPIERFEITPKRRRTTRDSEPKSKRKPLSSEAFVERPKAEKISPDQLKNASLSSPKTEESLTDIANQKPEPSPVIEKHGLTPLPQPVQVQEGPQVCLSSALPEWIRVPTRVSFSITTPFEQFREEDSLSGKIFTNLSKNGLTDANGLQSAILPMLLPGRQGWASSTGDLCISAATGSGKTLAYALPLIENLHRKAVSRLRGLIVVPTRELVDQVRETLEMCSAKTGIKIGTAVGSRSLKDERSMIVQKGQRWDPEAYKAEQEKVVDEDEDLMNMDFDAVLGPQDDFECWPYHVLEYSSKIDILVCTPGRLVEHISSTPGFSLDHVQWLVIDEADRLLAESFQEWIDILLPKLEHLPPLDSVEHEIYNTYHLSRRRELQKIILSATMTQDISKLMSLRMKHPKLLVLEDSRTANKTNGEVVDEFLQERSLELPRSLHEVAMAVTMTEIKPLYLLRLLSMSAKVVMGQQENEKDDMDCVTNMGETTNMTGQAGTGSRNSPSDPPSNISTSNTKQKSTILRGTLVFANSNEGALRLARLLAILLPEQQIKALTKSPGGKEGRKTLQMFRRGELSVIVATDLASRGLDISDLANVVNYDMPTSLKNYVHRVGRTARAGKEGTATTLVEHQQARWFWNEIARTNSVSRTQKVARMNQALEIGAQERQRYEHALEELGREAVGRSSEQKIEEDQVKRADLEPT